MEQNVTKFHCEICGNEDIKYIGFRNGKPYCRKCILFKGEKAEIHKISGSSVVLNLKYQLSKEQKIISDQIINNFNNKIDTLIDAVCGSGKTELVYGVIAHALSQNKLVGFAVPRRDVVIELFYRIKDAFPNNKVISLYGGHASKLEADIVVLTTHQLYRYKDYFDLLIMDEIDAFPFKGSDILYEFFNRSLKGVSVLMSATATKKLKDLYIKNNKDILQLNKRYHGHPLPVPLLKIRPLFLKYLSLIKYMKKFYVQNKQIFIFVPTVDLSKTIYFFLRLFFKNGNYVNSKKEDRAKVIEDFKNKKYQYLVTTAVLERGVTVKDLQVIVFQADHSIYDSGTLIQISGRVGRKIDAPKGDVIFIVDKETISIKEAINTIRDKNLYL